MKIRYFFFSFLITTFSFGQISIGQSEISSSSVLLEFGSTENRALNLPLINSTNSNISASEGTLIFDLLDNKVKYRNNNTWVDLSIVSGISSITEQLDENISAQVILDSETSSAQGVLVLESKNKAMVLPKVVMPHKNIINPSPGMIVYDPINNILAVFNGNQWTYWK